MRITKNFCFYSFLIFLFFLALFSYLYNFNLNSFKQTKFNTTVSNTSYSQNTKIYKVSNSKTQENLVINDKKNIKEDLKKQDNKDDKKKSTEDLMKKIFNINDFDILLGNKDSDIMIVEYTSMTCPHCKKFHEDIYPILFDKVINTNKVLYIIRDFPTDAISFRASLVLRKLKSRLDNEKRMRLRNIVMKSQDKIIKSIYENKNDTKKAFESAMNVIKEIMVISGSLTGDEFNQYIDFEKEDNKKAANEIISDIEEVSKLMGQEAGAPTFLIFNKKTLKFEKIEGKKEIEFWAEKLNNITEEKIL